MSLCDSLAAYVKWLDDVPLPTPEQRSQFADYVSHSHSWYKHITLYPPGVPFYFFLNKYAGWEREHGTPLVRERCKTGFHYAQIPTSVYRSSFGCLDYSLDGGRVPLVEEPRTVARKDWRDNSPGVGKLTYGAPDEILYAGASLASSVVHMCGVNPWYWDEKRAPADLRWPDESGGPETLKRIFEHCEKARHSHVPFDLSTIDGPARPYPSYTGQWCSDPILYGLLLPERQRQQRGMIEAMNRVCAIVQVQRDGST